MENGILKSPNLDNLTWQEIVDKAIALIPQYNPEWTDHSRSDLGITLIELFAWMSEQIIYRLNRVPDKNYIEFLNLLGITRDPCNPATAGITCQLAGDTTVVIPKGTQFSTSATETEDGMIFETQQEFNIINLKACLLLWEDSQDPNCPYIYQNLFSVLPPKFEQEHQEKTITITANSKQILMFGINTFVSQPLYISFKISEPSKPIGNLLWKYSSVDNGNSDPFDWQKLDSQPDYTLRKSDRLRIQVSGKTDWQTQTPADWSACPENDENEITDSLYWIGIEIENDHPTESIEFNINRLAANVISAINALTVKEEILGVSNGKPFQVLNLRNVPLHKNADGDIHLNLKIEENGIWNIWQRVDELSGGYEQYLCNPVTGEISFGNYPTNDPDRPGQGRIPDIGSQIKAESYRYSAGGKRGNIPQQSIEIQRNPVSGVVTVINEEPAVGGTNWEELEDTKTRAPKEIRSRHRAVTAEDYEFFAREASLEIADVRCLPPKRKPDKNGEIIWETDPLNRSLGWINMIILPADTTSRKPYPSQTLIDTVKNYLNARKTIGGLLNIVDQAPFYMEIKVVTATIYVMAGKNNPVTKEAIRTTLYNFFHPVNGGSHGQGWKIGQSLCIPHVYDLLNGLENVSYVENLTVEGINHKDILISEKGLQIPVEEHELICASEMNDTNFNINLEEDDFGLSSGV